MLIRLSSQLLMETTAPKSKEDGPRVMGALPCGFLLGDNKTTDACLSYFSNKCVVDTTKPISSNSINVNQIGLAR